MNKIWVALLASAVSGSVMAQSAVLYQPARTAKDQGLSIRGWGSGTISETDETAFEGTHSVRISTHNYFQGGILGFTKAIDLAKDFNSKTNLLKVTFKVADASVMSAGGKGGPAAGGGLAGSGGGSGKPPGFGKGGGAGFGFGGGAAGPGGPGGGQRGGFGGGAPGAGSGMMGGAPSAGAPELKFFRLIITTTDGKKSEVYAPADTSVATDQGWKTVAIPLQAITGLDRTNKEVQSIAFAGNTTSTFYVGDLRVVDDATPIRGEPNTRELNLALGDEFTFTAQGYGGASILRYTWDFDARDGIQVDAEGQAVIRKFRKAGNYTVTLTISDFYGLKQPYSTTIKVVVNP